MRFPEYEISDNYQAHTNRGSAEPGIDFKAPYGSPVYAPEDGTITAHIDSIAGAAGRRISMQGVTGWWDLIHNSRLVAPYGKRVKEGDLIAYSGASGYGRENYYGPHVHISYWPGQYKSQPAWANAVDFEPLIHAVNATSEGDKDMAIGFIQIKGIAGKRNGGIYAITPAIKGGKPNATFLGRDAKVSSAGIVSVNDEKAIARLQSLIDGLR